MTTEKLLWILIALESIATICSICFYFPYIKLKERVKGREEAYVRNSEITLKTIDSFVAERAANLEKLHKFQLQVSELNKELDALKAKSIQ